MGSVLRHCLPRVRSLMRYEAATYAYVMWDSAVSLEAQGTITVVMMLEEDFSNGLYGDMDFSMDCKQRCVKNS